MAPASHDGNAIALTAETPQAADNMSNTALVIYEPPVTDLFSPESSADIVKASMHIRDTASKLIDMLEEAFVNGEVYSNDEMKEMWELLRSQSTEHFDLSMAVKEHADTSHEKMKKGCGKYIERQANYFHGRERSLNNTINAQQHTINAQKHSLSNLTLHTGLMRGENQSLTNANYALHQRLVQLEGVVNENISLKEDLAQLSSVMEENHSLQEELAQLNSVADETYAIREELAQLKCVTNENLSLREELAQLKNSNGSMQNQMRFLQEQHKRNMDQLRQKSDEEKLAFERAKKGYEKRLSTATNTIGEIKKHNQNLKDDTDKVLETARQGTQTRCMALEEATKLREALKEKEKANEKLRLQLRETRLRETHTVRRYDEAYKNSQELKKTMQAECDEAKEKEMAAVAECDNTIVQLKKLQTEAQKKAYEVLTSRFIEAKKDAEYFAGQAKEAIAGELASLDKLSRMCPDSQGQ